MVQFLYLAARLEISRQTEVKKRTAKNFEKVFFQLTCDNLFRRFGLLLFFVFYSTMALCNVLQFFVNTGDKRLSSIIVKGERIFQQDEGNKQSRSMKLNYSGTASYGHLVNMVTSLSRPLFCAYETPIK